MPDGPDPSLEAVVFVRLNRPGVETVAQATIVVPTGGKSVAEAVGRALVLAGLADETEWSYT